MTSTADVSIIVPCYNAARFLPDTIRSVLDQEGVDIQLILVDDGSTDETPTIIAEVAKRDKRVLSLTITNSGVSAARNVGIKHARGEFLGFLDADDLLVSGSMLSQCAFLRAHPEYGAVAGSFERIDEAGRVISRELQSGDAIESRRMLLGNCVHTSSVLMRHDVVQKLKGMDTALIVAEDWDFFSRMILDGVVIGCQKRVVSQYRIVTNSLSSNPSRMTECCLRVMEKTFASPQLKQEWKEYRKEAEIRVRRNGASRALAVGQFEEARTQFSALQQLDKALFEQKFLEMAKSISAWLALAGGKIDQQFLAGLKGALPVALDQSVLHRHIAYGMERHKVMVKKRMAGFAAALPHGAMLFLKFPGLAMHDLFLFLSRASR